MNTTTPFDPSDTARSIAGTYIEDTFSHKSPLAEWIQSECRCGCFRSMLDKLVSLQEEPLRPDLTVVEAVSMDKITVRLPGRVSDHESASTFATDVTFEFNPVSQVVVRL